MCCFLQNIRFSRKNLATCLFACFSAAGESGPRFSDVSDLEDFRCFWTTTFYANATRFLSLHFPKTQPPRVSRQLPETTYRSIQTYSKTHPDAVFRFLPSKAARALSWTWLDLNCLSGKRARSTRAASCPDMNISHVSSPPSTGRQRTTFFNDLMLLRNMI